MAVGELVRVEGFAAVGGGEPYEFEKVDHLLALAELAAGMDRIELLFEQVSVPEVRQSLTRAPHAPAGLRLAEIVAELEEVLERVEPDEASPIIGLRVALTLAAEIWLHDSPAGGPGLRAVVVLAEPGSRLDVLDFESACLLWHEGSFEQLLGPALSLAGYAIQAGAFMLSLVPGRGAAGSSIAFNIVEDTRNAAVKEYTAAGLTDLIPPRLTIDTAIENGDEPVILLLHGLLSTDIGTFDAFLRHWKDERQAGTVPFARILSWPHDTLTSIGNNARKLAGELKVAFGRHRPPVAFVVHSRGGLLARRLAVEAAVGTEIRAKFRGAVTFGTPHEGADLANLLSGKHLAYFLSIAAAARFRSVYRLGDIFTYDRQQANGIEGIGDLRVPADDGFISRLMDDEAALEAGGRGRLPILAIGADHTSRNRRARWLAKSFFGRGRANDLIVTADSAAPATFPLRFTDVCAHGDYCATLNDSVRRAVRTIAGWLA
jgi:hypothetical protein